MTVQMTPESAASLFLVARGRGGENEAEDKAALSALIGECVMAGIATALGVKNPELGIEEFLRELTASEPESKTAPGLQISWLAERAMFYAAIHVFPMGNVASRHVLVKSLAADLTTCLVKLLVAYRENRGK